MAHRRAVPRPKTMRCLSFVDNAGPVPAAPCWESCPTTGKGLRLAIRARLRLRDTRLSQPESRLSGRPGPSLRTRDRTRPAPSLDACQAAHMFALREHAAPIVGENTELFEHRAFHHQLLIEPLRVHGVRR